jgi:predicted Fe-S protein YdhL (DUF1289 family)
MQWCVGCGRTGIEIQQWSDATDHDKRKMLAELPPRLAMMAKLQSGNF